MIPSYDQCSPSGLTLDGSRCRLPDWPPLGFPTARLPDCLNWLEVRNILNIQPGLSLSQSQGLTRASALRSRESWLPSQQGLCPHQASCPALPSPRPVSSSRAPSSPGPAPRCPRLASLRWLWPRPRLAVAQLSTNPWRPSQRQRRARAEPILP